MSKKKIIMKDVATQTNEYVKPELTYTDKLSKKTLHHIWKILKR